MSNISVSYPEVLTMTHADVLREKEHLLDLLKIPISQLVFSRFYCELFLSQQSIGYLPISQAPSGIRYDTSKNSVQKLDWAKVYTLHQAELNEQIEKHIQLKPFRAIPVSFRRLYVEDGSDQLIASFECTYENFEWQIRDEKILAPATEKKPM